MCYVHFLASRPSRETPNFKQHVAGIEVSGLFDLKDKDYCPIEIIKGLTDKGQFQYLTKLMGPQEGTYLYATQFHSLR